MLWNRGIIMPKQTEAISFAPQTIGNLLQAQNLRVPPSQRSYRWEKEHVEELFTDIKDAMASDSEEYFLGSIVGIRSGGATFIYDGQQRLATTMILVAAIRDYFHKSGDQTTADIVQGKSLLSQHQRTHEEEAHFRLNNEDHGYFQDRILLPPDHERRKQTSKPIRESHKRINSAAKIAAEFVNTSIIAGLSPEKSNDELHDWLEFIKDSLRVIWVQVDDERTAFTIFETMNDRGLRLSAADLLKNYLYAIADNRRDEVIQKWQSMTGTLETIEGEAENVVEYVRCYWVTGHGHTRTKVLFDEIKREATNKTKAIVLASDLENAVQDYAAILLSSHEKLASRGESVRRKIEVIRSLGVTQVRPLLLAAFRKFTAKEFDRLLDACVSWSVRALLSGVRSGTIEGYYSRNAFDIFKSKITTTAQVQRDMANIIPGDTQFQLSVSTALVSIQPLARYYLRALQRCEDGEKEPQYIPNPGPEITLEHILPRNPTPGKGWDHFSPDDQKNYVNRLGNQVLLPGTVNSEIGNTPYTTKKSALAKSHYSLTHETSKHVAWGKSEIQSRQERLARLAVKTWPLA